MREATTEELAQWDELVAANPDGGNQLQVRAFGETKGKHGWKPKYYIHDIAGVRLAVLYLTRPVPLLGEIWYAPKGPGVINYDQLKQWGEQAKQLPAFMVKIEPELLKGSVTPLQLSKHGIIKAPRDIQYNTSTVVVDLTPDEDPLIDSFKQKTRYNIRLAARKGVSVEAVPTDDASVDTMYALMQATQGRAGFFLRSREYFGEFWRSHAASGAGQMFLAKYEGEVLAGAFITYVGRKALYKDGGSFRVHSDLQAAYLLQWEIIRWLKGHGVTEYDLHGSPSQDQAENKDHPLYSVGRFKYGFNQDITEYVGTYDLVVDAKAYARWNKLGERLATAYEFKLKKQLYY